MDFESDAAAQPQQEEKTLQRALALGAHLERCAAAVTAAQEDLDDAKEALRKVEQEDLPELMRELGLDMFRMDSGYTVELTDEVACAITEQNRAKAHAWLVEKGFDGLIKTEVTCAFGRGERDAAMAAAQSIGGFVVEKVHPSTLKSFIKEQLAAGQAVPFDLFSVHPYARAKLSSKKK